MLKKKEMETMFIRSFRKPDWYYHAFLYEGKDFTDMVTGGIKCRKLLGDTSNNGKNYIGNNGGHYISLSKMMFIPEKFSSYVYYINSPAFIIEGIRPLKCKYSFDSEILNSTILPFRTSSFYDEYQQFWKINRDSIVGLRSLVFKWYLENDKQSLEGLRDMIVIMKRFNFSIPVYDYSRMTGLNVMQLNTDEYLDKFDDILESSYQKMKKAEKK